MAENLSTKTSTKPSAATVTSLDDVDDATYKAMLDILDDLTDHTHIFFDNYRTACNCNCNCACTRGIL